MARGVGWICEGSGLNYPKGEQNGRVSVFAGAVRLNFASFGATGGNYAVLTVLHCHAGGRCQVRARCEANRFGY